MLDLSPTKLIIVFVVAIVLLGPKRLPQVARQLGAAWTKIRAFSQRIDGELRQTLPDLPTGRDIVRYARSPITLLNDLADGAPGPRGLVEDPAAPADGALRAVDGHSWPPDRAGDGTGSPPGFHAGHGPAAGRADGLGDAELVDLARLAVDDPTLN